MSADRDAHDVGAIIDDLNGRIDAIALDVITQIGIFGGDNPSDLDDAIDAIEPEPGTRTDAIIAAQQRAATGRTEDVRRKAVQELEDLATDDVERVRWNAYLLGIAVGRRLGPAALAKGGE